MGTMLNGFTGSDALPCMQRHLMIFFKKLHQKFATKCLLSVISEIYTGGWGRLCRPESFAWYVLQRQKLSFTDRLNPVLVRVSCSPVCAYGRSRQKRVRGRMTFSRGSEGGRKRDEGSPSCRPEPGCRVTPDLRITFPELRQHCFIVP